MCKPDVLLYQHFNSSDLHVWIFSEKTRCTLNAITEDYFFISVLFQVDNSSNRIYLLALRFLNNLPDALHESVTSVQSTL